MNLDLYKSLIDSEKYDKLANTTYEVTENISPRTKTLILQSAQDRDQLIATIEAEPNQNLVFKHLQTLMRQLLGDLETIYTTLNGSVKVTMKEHEFLERIRAQIFLVLYISDVTSSKIAITENISANMDALINGVIGSMDVDLAMERYAVNFQDASGVSAAGSISLDSREFDTIRFNVNIPNNLSINQGLNKIFNLIISAQLSQTGVRLLLSGPPGIGKTMAAHFIAKHWSNSKNLFILSQGNLLETYVGESEKRLMKLFNYFQNHPSVKGVLFMDEGDEFLANDVDKTLSGSKNVIQTNLGDINNFNNLCIVLATNFPEKIASPIHNRFTTFIEYPSPSINDVCEVVYNFLNIDKDRFDDQPEILKNLADDYRRYWKEKIERELGGDGVSYRSANSIVTTFQQNMMSSIVSNSNKSLYIILNPSNGREILFSTKLPGGKIDAKFFTSNAQPLQIPFELEFSKFYHFKSEFETTNIQSLLQQGGGFKWTLIAD